MNKNHADFTHDFVLLKIMHIISTAAICVLKIIEYINTQNTL